MGPREQEGVARRGSGCELVEDVGHAGSSQARDLEHVGRQAAAGWTQVVLEEAGAGGEEAAQRKLIKEQVAMRSVRGVLLLVVRVTKKADGSNDGKEEAATMAVYAKPTRSATAEVFWCAAQSPQVVEAHYQTRELDEAGDDATILRDGA